MRSSVIHTENFMRYIFFVSSGQTLTSRMKLQENGGRLILNGLELSDAANYSCFANNLYGQDSITYQLIVKRKSDSMKKLVSSYSPL